MATFLERSVAPIETAYNGYRFRSRLEARWAVFFDTLRIKYSYEAEGFDLGPGGWYLPDFFLWEPADELPENPSDGFGVWVEIKPGEPNQEEIRKCVYLAREESDWRVILLAGNPQEGEYGVHFFGDWPFLVERKWTRGFLNGPLLFCGACSQPSASLVEWSQFDREWWHPTCHVCDGFMEDPRPELRAAYAAAKDARFNPEDLRHARYTEKTRFAGEGWIEHVRDEIQSDIEWKDQYSRPNSCTRCGRSISHAYRTCYNCRDAYY